MAESLSQRTMRLAKERRAALQRIGLSGAIAQWTGSRFPRQKRREKIPPKSFFYGK